MKAAEKAYILTHPNIPKPLHGISPRTIMGQEWWDIERKRCYKRAGQRCEACGTEKDGAWPNRWLEAHEEYSYEGYPVIEFAGLVCLCPACHKFIHSGWRSVAVGSGSMSYELNERIQKHGENVLKENGMFDKYMKRQYELEWNEWSDFRVSFNGKLYGPSSISYLDWKNGAWKRWSPR